MTAHAVDETPLCIRCGDAQLVAMLAQPAATRDAEVGVVIVVGGPQYRAGSHRQFLHLSRRLAAFGWPVLRFDYRGMGDSEGAPRSFETVSEDIAVAVDALQQQTGVRQVVLWGLCDGASAALMHAPADPRIRGLVLANPWARGAESFASAQLKHYYARRVLDPAFWRKLLGGGVKLRASLAEFIARLGQARAPARPAADFRQRMLDALARFDGRILWLLSGRDLTAQEFLTWIAQSGAASQLTAEGRRRTDLPDADHTFSSATLRERVELLTADWLRTEFGAGR